MEVVVERCAALDVHKYTVVACVRRPGSGSRRGHEVREFRTLLAVMGRPRREDEDVSRSVACLQPRRVGRASHISQKPHRVNSRLRKSSLID